MSALDIQIEKNVPIPSRNVSRGTPWKDLVRRMNIGDSVVISKKGAQQLYQALKALNYTSTRRQVSKTKTRLWKGKKID